MTTLFRTSLIYMIAGVASGVFYREFTKLNNFAEGQVTQLSFVHTHLLTLGFLVFLIVLLLEKSFTISRSPRLFKAFLWLYNIGLIVTAATLAWHGSLTVLGETSNAMIAGIAGLGHITLTAGLVCFFIALGKAVKATEQQKQLA